MPSLTLPDRLIWFAHCPKAGGTSVEQFMVARWGDAVGHLHWGWDRWWRSGGWRLAAPPNSPQHLVWEDAVSALPRAPDAVFAVVRDPVARMTSEYRWQRGGQCRSWLGRLMAFLPFSFWLRLMLAAAGRAPHAFDNHFRPQSDFVPEMAAVFRLENGLNQVADWLAAITGEQITEDRFPHALPTQNRTQISSCDRALIARNFAVDYYRFGYVPETGLPQRGLADRLAEICAPLVAGLDRRGWL
ncbi:MAG: sulfotransferase family protein [Paracoccaceae bacterium]|nr:sulfotransferase family protein [Paracoccaceae bacterium]